MTRASYSRAILVAVALISVVLLTGGSAYAKERQLAGVRLNEHAVALLELYGPPDGIVTGPAGPAFPVAAPGLGTMDRAMAAARGAGALAGFAGATPEEAGIAGVVGGVAEMMMDPLLMEEEMRRMGPGAFPGAPGEMGAPGAAAVGAPAGVVPNWALPIYIDTAPGEMMWLYQRGGVTLGFLLDLDGYVQAIAVAADECSYARSAMWEPHKYLKMGDHYARVLQRYGWPDDTITYQASGLAGSVAGATVSFQSSSKTFSRDCIMRYTENGNNIDFTLHDFRIVRMHIWD